jgi:superfamily I DNA/RNA helicase
MALRRRACEHYIRLRANLPPGESALLPADQILDAAGEDLGLLCEVLMPDNPLLEGANGVLDIESGAVWLSRDLPLTRRRFVRAHEYAHAWLHEGMADVCGAEDAPDTFLPASYRSPSAQIAEGYSPKERREAEANVFASEFLLPSPLLRYAYIVEERAPAQIAALVGVSESAVYAQLANALLLPPFLLETEPQTQAHAAASGQLALFHVPPQPPPQLPHLDPSQRAAAETLRGPALVDAGPGTGKTRTLIGRIVYLLQVHRLAPENLVALTYTNKAAEEMQTRLRAAVGIQADRVWISTFHAFGYEILRKEGHRLGLPLTPQLLETSAAVELLERHVDRLPLDKFLTLHRPGDPLPAILYCIARAKDNLQTPQDYLQAAYQQMAEAQDEKEHQRALRSIELAHIYAVYQQLLTEYRLLDFGDLLLRPIELFENHPDALQTWQARYLHVLADEYQDVNRATARLLRLLTGDGRGFWAVGDLRQTIYRFQGASPANVREFEQDYPQGKRFTLQVNYRSLPPLTRLFDAVAARLSLELAQDGEPRWSAQRPAQSNPAIWLAEPENEAAQADGLAALIRQRLETGTPLREQAILCPRNDQASEMASLLAARGIPTQHLGSLFDRPEVKDMLALLAVACEPRGGMLARVARFPEYLIPTEDVVCLLEWAKSKELQFPQAFACLADVEGLSSEGREGLLRLWSHIEPLLNSSDAWAFLTRYLFDRSSYLRPLLTSEQLEAQQRLLAIRQLLVFALGVGQKLPPVAGVSPLAQFLGHIRRLLLCHEDHSARAPEGAEELDAVRVMTIHSAKGLEFGAVYLPNLIDGQFPHRKPNSRATPPPRWNGQEQAEPADTDESLYFVALTRARDYLTLSSPRYWRGKAAQPSSLLEKTRDLFMAQGAQRLVWQISPVEARPPVVQFSESAMPQMTSSARLMETAPALEGYWECPRRYYYERVARLPASREGTTYFDFYRSLDETLRWAMAQRREGTLPALPEMEAKLEATWAKNAPGEPDASRRLLQQRASELLAHAHAQILLQERASSALELVADLPSGRVMVRADHVERDPKGGVRLVRHHRRPPRDDDHTEERLAVLRRAARQRFSSSGESVEIELLYLSNGERLPVKEKAGWESKRVEKYEAALIAIRERRFPPRPEGEKCAQCPFLFLCPL